MNNPIGMASNFPFFSVITVVYNDLEGLRRTEGSVRAQVESDFEWIVVDGGSSDGTASYLEQLKLPYLEWTSKRDRGIYDAMNIGTAKSKGRYVLYLNGGDDFADGTCLQNVRRALEKADYPELCYGGGNWLFANGLSRYRPPRAMESAIRHGLPGIHQATLYRRDFISDAPYDLSYAISGDYYISADCFLRGARVCYEDWALVNFSVGGISMKKANQSLGEAWRIQRDVLRLGWFFRMVSAARRFAAHRYLALLHRRNQRRDSLPASPDRATA